MSYKTNFKRIALAVVAALGFGVLASGPSSAVIQVGSTMTATAVNTSVKTTETASATIAFSMTSIGAIDTVVITAVQTAGGTAGPGATSAGFRNPLAADSASAASLVVSGATSRTFTALTATNVDRVVTFNARFDVDRPTTPGTYTYTFYAAFPGGNTATPPAPVTYTFTVTGSDRVMTAATSVISDITALATRDIRTQTTDSVVVANGLGVQTPVAAIFVKPTNAAGETVTQLSPQAFTESVTATISGPGLLAVATANNGSAGTAARFVTLIGGTEHLRVLSDGTGGVATITLTKGTTSQVLATETVNFSGAASTATLTLGKAVTSKQASDSQTIVRLVIEDAAKNILPVSSDSWFVHSSDTSVVSNATSTTGCRYTYNTTNKYATCGITLGDTGTTKIKLANFAFGTAAASLPATQIVSNELDLRVVGSAATVKLAFDKSVYAKGEEITFTVTARDADGFVIPSQTVSGLLSAGVDFTPGTDITDTVVALTDGVGKLTATASQLTGAFTAVYKGGAGLPTAGQTLDTLTATVFDGAEEAANSALDAAQEATDAAIAATDAAILAQEAADEAASAAIAAQETAQAAVDAVTALSAEVTKLVAQLATLQKLLNRVAKRVGVKL
jgi:hypothetical protein